MQHHRLFASVAFLVIASACTLRAQTPAADSWTFNAVNEYRITPNVDYSTANNYDCRLDVYARNNPSGPTPTVLYIHGGGWVAGMKETSVMNLLPYLEMGLSVVNVEYRLARVSLAPAAVEDCRLALRWVFKNAKQYGFDTTKIVVTGGSAGGHLALMTGMLEASDGFDLPTDWDYAGVQPKVAAIVNWFGITDVKDLLAGSNKQNYAIFWIGDQNNKQELAQRVSPLSYVRKNCPPIFTVQGDNDNLVPYSQSVRLHEKLTEAGVPNKLMTIPGGRHGGFTKEQMSRIFGAIKDFLKANKIIE
jgi:acetyl esterase/lipase